MLNRFKQSGLTEPKSEIITSYSEKAKIETEEILRLGKGNLLEFDECPFKREEIEGFTIDGSDDSPETQDRDDGINAYRSSKGGYFIIGSIADVSSVIKPFTELDLQAFQKGESEYLPDSTVHMFPIEIINNILSLDGGKKRLADTYIIELDSDGGFLGVEKKDTVFYNKKAYTYDGFDRDFNNPDSENYEKLQLFYEIMLKLKSKNNLRGEVVSDFGVSSVKSNGNLISQKIIEEFMKIINHAANIYANQNDIKVAHRNHMPEYKLKTFMGGKMDMAFYYTKMLYHYGLKYNNYMHITSPIRRYADLFSVRGLKSHSWGLDPIYNDIEHEYALNFINKRKFLVRGKVLGEYKKYEVKKQTILKHKAIKGKITDFELSSMGNDNFELVINYFLGEKVFVLSDNVESELIKRIKLKKISDDLLILIYLSGNKKYNDLVYSNLESKYDNPDTYILNYVYNYSPIENNVQKYSFGEKGYKHYKGKKLSIYDENDNSVYGDFCRVGYIKYNGEILKSIEGDYNTNSEGKRNIRNKLCEYLVDTKINFSKSILDMKNYYIEDVIGGNYSQTNLSRISLKNFEDIIIYFITNNIKFSDSISSLIYDRINSSLLLTNLSISFLIFSKNELFSQILKEQLVIKKSTRNIIKFLNMNKDFNIDEKIDELNQEYSIKIDYLGKNIIDFSYLDLDEIDFIHSYVDIINFSRMIVLEELLKIEDIDFFSGLNLKIIGFNK